MKWSDDDAGKISLVGLSDGALRISGEVKGMFRIEDIEKRISRDGAICKADGMTDVSAAGVIIELID